MSPQRTELDLLYGHDAEVIRYVRSKLGEDMPMHDAIAIGVLRGGRIAGGFVYNHYSGRNIFATVAGDKPWLSRRVIRAFFAYPFDQLGCERMSALVRRDNIVSQRLTKGVGFKAEGLLRSAFQDGEDGVLFGILKQEVKW